MRALKESLDDTSLLNLLGEKSFVFFFFFEKKEKEAERKKKVKVSMCE